MATQVRETAAGQSISAYVVLNKKGEHVATVNAHFANSGRVTVDVWNHGDKATLRCYDAAMSALEQPARAAALAKAKRDALALWDWRKGEDATRWAAYDLFGLQQSSASGYGYDKFASALAGLWIDGHQMANHCGSVANAQKAKDALMRAYIKSAVANGGAVEQKEWNAKAQKLGAHFANWSTERGAFTSLHFIEGLKRLETLGYKVIQAI